MKRAAPVLLAILLGAFATAIGMGAFLKLANDDRARLADQIEQARADAERALKDKETIANEANEKVATANEEVAKAQRVLQQLEEERKLLANAKQLQKPATRDTRNWRAAVSLPLGLSLLLPPRTSVELNDAQALTSVKDGMASSTTGARWFSALPYSERVEQDLLSSLATSTVRSYLVNGRLVTGRTGILSENGAFSVFRVHQSGSSTHLLWIKDPGTLGSGNGIERLLGTMEFAP